MHNSFITLISSKKVLVIYPDSTASLLIPGWVLIISRSQLWASRPAWPWGILVPLGWLVREWICDSTLINQIYGEIWWGLPEKKKKKVFAFLKKSSEKIHPVLLIRFSCWFVAPGVGAILLLVEGGSDAEDGRADRWKEVGTGWHHWAVEFADSGPPVPTAAGALGFVREIISLTSQSFWFQWMHHLCKWLHSCYPLLCLYYITLTVLEKFIFSPGRLDLLEGRDWFLLLSFIYSLMLRTRHSECLWIFF